MALWAAYVALACAAFTCSFATLMVSGWADEFQASGERVTGLYIADLLLAFFQDAADNWASTAVMENLGVLMGASVFSFMAEASRRRVDVPQAVVGALMLLAQTLGVCGVVPLFLAMLNRSRPRQLPREEHIYELNIVRAFYLLASNVVLLAALAAIPATASVWPGGPLSNTALLVFLFLPALPTLGFAFDGTGRGEVSQPRDAAQRSISDRELAHYLVMLSCAISALAGLFAHLRLVATLIMYGGVGDFAAAAVATAPAAFLVFDFAFLTLACYLWLQAEAMGPVKSYFEGSGLARSDNGRLLSWRDMLALVVFGPACHFSLAFAGREYGLLKLDSLRLKSM